MDASRAGGVAVRISGNIGNIAPISTNIENSTYPFNRLLYSVYRNSFSANNVATPALDYIGEKGWICKGAKAGSTVDGDVWTVRADGTHPHRVIKLPHACEAAVSPSGGEIAFERRLRADRDRNGTRLPCGRGRLHVNEHPLARRATSVPDRASCDDR